MKRQVFLQTTRTIPDKTGSVIALRVSSNEIPDLVLPGDSKVHLYGFPLELVALGGRDFHLSFKAAKELIDNGVVLVGAYLEGNQVRVTFINFGKDLRLKEKQVIIEVALTEEVRFFQGDLNGAVALAGSNLPAIPVKAAKKTRKRG